MAWETPSELKMEEGKSEEAEWQAEGEWRMGEVAERGMRERRGLEAGKSPVVPLVEAGEKGMRGEGGGSEKERRMRREMEGQREVQVQVQALEESQGGALDGKKGKIDV